MTIALIMCGFALLLGVAAAVRPVWYASAAFLILVFAKTADHLSDGLLAYADEVAIVVGVLVLVTRRVVLRRRVRWLPGLGWFAAFGVLGVFSGLVSGVPLSTIAVGAFLALKGVLFGWAVVQIEWTERAIRSVVRGSAVVIAVTLIATVANAFAPGPWTSVLTDRDAPQLVAGLPALVGPFTHPGDLGLVLALAAIAVLAYRAVIGRGWVSLVLLVGSVVGSFASLRRKSIVGLAAGAAVVLGRTSVRKRNLLIAGAVLAATAAVVLASSGVLERTISDYVINGSTHPRVLLTWGGAVVATAAFPLGVGFGRFGSYLASVDYSPVYVQLGFDQIPFVGPGSHYLTDTQWPMIVGEAGWIGAAAFVVGLVRVWLAVARSWRAEGSAPFERLVALIGMGWFVQILIESIAAPVFVTSPSSGVLFFAVALVAARSSARAEESQARLGERVDRLVAYQWDPRRPSLGGVDTCLRGLASYRPEGRSIVFVGVDAVGDKELGVWTRVTVSTSGRPVWFLPVARLDPDTRRRLLPHGVRLAYGLARFRGRIPRPTVVQAHKLETGWALHALFPGVPLVYSIHSQGGALAARGSDSFWSHFGSLHARGERALVRRSASVVVYNPDYAHELTTVSPHVHAATTWFDPGLRVDGVARDPYLVIWAGRMEPPKDPGLAIDAFVSLIAADDASPWRLHLIGSGSLLDQVRDRVANLSPEVRERISVREGLPPTELAAQLAASGVLLMTTQAGYEGYPRLLIEGLAAGLPAVVTQGTDTGGLIAAGLSGHVCGRDPVDLARAIAASTASDRAAIAASVAALDGSVMVPEIFRMTDADAQVAS